MNVVCSIFLTLFVVFRPLVPWVDYAVNYTYISEVLCINKNVPQVHCKGKCYLSKELAVSNDTDSSPLHKSQNSGQKVLDIYILPEITEIQETVKRITSNFTFLYESKYSFMFLKHIFHPPIF
ncbi:hypothetical protein [Chryseobacterium oryctis]|uniref:Uncharacterized protein n=1 Tax=Chryseobacterium oryctis TaxID=2952618 RepID=A0ABT3HQS2_9FLAO|nr:hypothetical protein [Chryseobacterium oryctis]MCW3162137.1 hypothetical protein [Chryseobacterium oryctis]